MRALHRKVHPAVRTHSVVVLCPSWPAATSGDGSIDCVHCLLYILQERDHILRHPLSRSKMRVAREQREHTHTKYNEFMMEYRKSAASSVFDHTISSVHSVDSTRLDDIRLAVAATLRHNNSIGSCAFCWGVASRLSWLRVAVLYRCCCPSVSNVIILRRPTTTTCTRREYWSNGVLDPHRTRRTHTNSMAL